MSGPLKYWWPRDQAARDLDAQIFEAMARIPDGPTPYAQACTAANTALPPHVSASELIKQVERVLAEVPPEPLGEWMREQGFPPESCTLMLPLHVKAQLPFWPRYVQFSAHLSGATLMRLNPDTFGRPGPFRPLDLGRLR